MEGCAPSARAFRRWKTRSSRALGNRDAVVARRNCRYLPQSKIERPWNCGSIAQRVDRCRELAAAIADPVEDVHRGALDRRGRARGPAPARRRRHHRPTRFRCRTPSSMRFAATERGRRRRACLRAGARRNRSRAARARRSDRRRAAALEQFAQTPESAARGALRPHVDAALARIAARREERADALDAPAAAAAAAALRDRRERQHLRRSHRGGRRRARPARKSSRSFARPGSRCSTSCRSGRRPKVSAAPTRRRRTSRSCARRSTRSASGSAAT